MPMEIQGTHMIMLQVCDRVNREATIMKHHFAHLPPTRTIFKSQHYQVRSIQQGTAHTRPFNQSLKQDTFEPAVEPLSTKVAQS